MSDKVLVDRELLENWESQLDQIAGAWHISDEIASLLSAQPQASAAQSAPAGECKSCGATMSASDDCGGDCSDCVQRHERPQRTISEAEAFREWFRTPEAQEAGSKSGWCGMAMAAWQASAAWQRKQSAGVPEGWRVERRELDGSVCFIIGSPRIAGVRSNTSVWESDSDPAHLLLWHMLAAAPAQPAAQDQGEVQRLR